MTNRYYIGKHVKIHNLYCVENTPLAEQVRSGEVKLMQRDEYVQTLIEFLELLPPEIGQPRVHERVGL